MAGAVHDGRVHDLAGALRRTGVVQRGEDADDEVEGAARVVAQQVGGRDRRPLGRAGHAEGAGDGDVADVVARARRERSVLAPAGHPAVHQAGVALQADLRADAEPFGHPGAEALDEHVGTLDQREGRRHTVRRLEVQQNGTLVAVGDVVLGRNGETAAAGPLDADHVGTEVGQCHGGERARTDTGQLHDAHPGQWAPGLFSRCSHRAPSTVTQLM
ncbi:hypothetical protein STAL104432_32080 [Streptomyces albus]